MAAGAALLATDLVLVLMSHAFNSCPQRHASRDKNDRRLFAINLP